MMKRIMAVLLIIAFIVSYIPPGSVVKAAGTPVIHKVYLNGETDAEANETLKYEILGENFDNPKVWIEYRQLVPDFWDDGRAIVEINSDNQDIFIEGPKTIKIINGDGATSDPYAFNVEVPPYVTGISKTKVYVGESLNIFGTGFLEGDLSHIYICGKNYDVATEVYIESDSWIHVYSVKAPVTPDMRDIMVTRDASAGDNPADAIRGILKDKIRVVGKLDNIEVISLEPDAGSVEGGTIVRMMGDTLNDKAHFQSNMRVYFGDNLAPVDSVDTIKDEFGEVIGLQVETPPADMPGPCTIVIKDEGENNEYTVPITYTYLEAENALRVEEVIPNNAEETEQREIEVKGKNIATINIDEIQDISLEEDRGYDPVAKEYTLVYSGTYDDDPYDANPPQAVTIERKIKLTIGRIVTIDSFTDMGIQGDTLLAHTPIITLDPGENERDVDVVVTTETIVTGGISIHRIEESVLEDGFKYTRDSIPVIDSITPGMGPYNQDIYITIEGSNFQAVHEVVYGPGGEEVKVPVYPVVQVGNKVIDPNNGDYMEVYNDQGILLDGDKYQLGTKIITKIPAAPDGIVGYVDVTVTNPEGYADTAEHAFQFKVPPPESEWPVIEEIVPDRGKTDGGDTVEIRGKRFDYVGGQAKCTVTIGGAVAEIDHDRSSSYLLTITTPPGTVGPKTVQVINEDGSMAQVVDGFYYGEVSTTPEIYSIVPDFGGPGTQVIIKGKDFVFPDPGSAIIHNKIGTRVLLDGVDVNTYLTDGSGNIQTDPFTGEVLFDPDVSENPSGKRVEVVDPNTLKVIIPPGLPIGPKDVTVLNPDIADYTVPDGFYYKSPASNPQITSIDPDEGSVDGGTVVTIQGSDFREGVKVYFENVEATDVWVNGEGTIIRATTAKYTISDPDADSEEVDVTVLNYDGGSCTLADGFTYRIPGSEPVITEIEPNFGTTAGGEVVNIRGKDFRNMNDGGEEENPKVYFGGVEAEDVEYAGPSLLKVTYPAYPEEGKVDVVIVNPDSGTYTFKDGFEYRRSNPGITSIVPSKGSKYGDLEIVIRGTEFKPDDLTDNFAGEVVYEHVYADTPTIDLRVVFGDEKESATIVGGKATVTIGNIKVEYDATAADNTQLYHIPSSGSEQAITDAVCNIEPGDYHLFIINGPEDLGDDTIVDEGIIVEVTDTEVIVTRRVAPYVQYVEEQSALVVRTPPVPTIGKRTVYVINRDGGTAEGIFEYTNPVSNPQITDITPRTPVDEGGVITKYYTESSVDGELPITITGSDFRTGVEVFVGGNRLDDVSLSADGTRITAVVPPGTADLVDHELEIIVQNVDGESVNSAELPIPRYFVYRWPESFPVITAVKPPQTSAAGGNTVTIVGSDFREGMKVFIGTVEVVVMGPPTYTQDGMEIEIRTPGGLNTGKYDVTVQNPDFGTATLKDGLTIISTPEIHDITNEHGVDIDTISFLGGDDIIIEGANFESGARVIFGGQVKYASEAPDEQGIEGINRQDENIKVVGGKEATGVEVKDANTISLITPAGVEGSVTVIVINPDNGISNVYNMEYTLPVPDAPGYLDVSLVYDRYVRLEWPRVDDAMYYEIYASKESRHDFKFIESTTRNVFYIRDLEPDTEYYFKVKAINKYGSSDFTSHEAIETEDTGEGDKDGGIMEVNRITVSGDKADIALSYEDMSKSWYYSYAINISDDQYRNVSTMTVIAPARVTNKAFGPIIFNAGHIKLQFAPSILSLDPIDALSGSELDKGYGRLIVTKANNADTERAMRYLPRDRVVVSPVYSISAETQYKSSVKTHASVNGSIDMEIAPYKTVNEKMALYRFDSRDRKWVPIESGLNSYYNTVYGRSSGLGMFVIMEDK